MATKSERFRAEQERRKAHENTTTERAAPDPTTNESERAGKKATYAFEGTGSRKSTRKSANRAKPDAAMTIREEFRRNTPKERHNRETTR